jgi:hypothetical protein
LRSATQLCEKKKMSENGAEAPEADGEYEPERLLEGDAYPDEATQSTQDDDDTVPPPPPASASTPSPSSSNDNDLPPPKAPSTVLTVEPDIDDIIAQLVAVYSFALILCFRSHLWFL